MSNTGSSGTVELAADESDKNVRFVSEISVHDAVRLDGEGDGALAVLGWCGEPNRSPFLVRSCSGGCRHGRSGLRFGWCGEINRYVELLGGLGVVLTVSCGIWHNHRAGVAIVAFVVPSYRQQAECFERPGDRRWFLDWCGETRLWFRTARVEGCTALVWVRDGFYPGGFS